MARSLGNCVLTLVVGLSLAGMTGCAGTGASKPWSIWPFNEKTTDVVPGVPSPAERITLLRQVAKKSATASADEQERVSRELADVYRQEDDPLIRAEITRALAGYKTEAAASVLRTAMNDANTDVRIAACKAWGRRRDEQAVSQLSRVLGSDVDVDVRLTAAEALGETGNRAAVTALGQVLNDRDPAMQYRAVASLRKVGEQDFGNDVERWRAYVKGETPGPEKPVSVVERFRRMF
jgi:HEAT repeat protein